VGSTRTSGRLQPHGEAATLLYGRRVENCSERIDRVDISDTAEQYSVLLSADDRPVVLVRMTADALAEDVVNGA
jgi:hypothetical protein